MPQIQYAEYTRVRGAISKVIKVHTNIHKYADWIFADTRAYTRTFAQVHRDVSAYALGHVSP